MKTNARCTGLLLFAASAIAAAAADKISGDEILGQLGYRRRRIQGELVRTGDAYSGKITWVKEATRDGKPVLDARNTNSALRSRPILGLEILSGFTRSADGTWKGGIAYSPRKGRSYPGEIALTKDNRLDIKVKDGMFSKHLFWTR